MKLKENENTAQENFWDTLKSVLHGEFIVLSIFIKVIRAQVNDLMIQLKNLEKEEQTQMQQMAKSNKNQSRNNKIEAVQRISESKTWFSKMINEITEHFPS